MNTVKRNPVIGLVFMVSWRLKHTCKTSPQFHIAKNVFSTGYISEVFSFFWQLCQHGQLSDHPLFNKHKHLTDQQPRWSKTSAYNRLL